MSGSDHLSRVFGLLSDPYRRELVAMLLDQDLQDGGVDPSRVSESGTADPPGLVLSHGHLPKLEHAGVIRWNRETREVRKGPEWDEISPLIELIRDHQDEFP